MADQKISALTELTGASMPIAVGDEFVVVDKDDTTQAASGTTKRITRSNLLGFSVASAPAWMPIGAAVSTATGVANTWYCLAFNLFGGTTITGVQIKNGATTNGNLRSALYNFAGGKVAERTSDLAQAGSTNTLRQVSFDSAYVAPTSGLYFALIWFSSATAQAFMAPGMSPSLGGGTGTNATTVPTTVSTSSLWSVACPILWPY